MLCGLLGLAACRSVAPAPPTANDVAHGYVALVVELGERDADSLDFSIASGPSRDPQTLDALHRGALALLEQASHLPENSAEDHARKALLSGQIATLVLRAEQLQGKSRSFDEESRIFFGIVAPEDHDAATRGNIRAQLAALLGDATHPAKSYSRYDAQFVVPPARVPAVMDEALRQCRAITLAHMALPPNESVKVAYVYHKPWSAFSRYLGHAQSLIQVNMDYPLTVDRLLTLACHEGYPGHHVFNSIRDQALAQHREEFQVQPTFSPQSYVSEAAASYAPQLALSAADSLRIERDVLFPLAGIKRPDTARYLEVQQLIAELHTAEPSIARDYLDDRLEFVRAADALERETLMEHGEAALLYLNEFRTYVLAYTTGNDSVHALIEAGHPTDAERWQRYIDLMTQPVVSLPSSAPSSRH